MIYPIFHNSYTSAIQAAEKAIESKGFKLDPEELAVKVGCGPSKPEEGKSNRFSFSIIKDGKLQKKMAHVQIYGLDSGKFELNLYVL